MPLSVFPVLFHIILLQPYSLHAILDISSLNVYLVHLKEAFSSTQMGSILSGSSNFENVFLSLPLHNGGRIVVDTCIAPDS